MGKCMGLVWKPCEASNGKLLGLQFRVLDMRYEVREYDCGDRDGNKMVIEGVEEDNLSPAGEIST